MKSKLLAAFFPYVVFAFTKAFCYLILFFFNPDLQQTESLTLCNSTGDKNNMYTFLFLYAFSYCSLIKMKTLRILETK